MTGCRAFIAAVDQRSYRKAFFVALLIYLVLGLGAYWPAWPGDSHLIVGGAIGDPVQQSWFLMWFPWAVLHGHNPFYTTWMDYPIGVNLSVNTEMPLLGVLGAPVSFTLGPVATYQSFLWLAYPLSAISAFFVLRRLTRSNIGAFTGGLLYGFSPYIVGQGYGHLNLAFVPLPPLIFLSVIEIFTAQGRHPWRWGGLLGVLVVLQYFISVEILASTLILVGIGIGIAGLRASPQN